MPSSDPIECTNHGHKHGHSTFDELARCVGTARLLVAVIPGTGGPTATASGPATAPSGGSVRPIVHPATTISSHTGPGVTIKDPLAPATTPQLKYIRTLGGSWRDSVDSNKGEASALIEMLKDPDVSELYKLPRVPLDDDAWEAFPIEREYQKNPSAFIASWNRRYWALEGDSLPTAVKPVSTPPSYVEDDDDSAATASTTLLAMMPLFDRVPDGYFAVQGSLKEYHFIRISRPKSGRWKGSIKVQTIHGENLQLAWSYNKTRHRAYTYNRSYDIEKFLLEIMTDWSKAARMYAKKIERCCRCNARLTDDRSRKYGIGPECEKYWPHIIAEVDEELAAGGA